MKIIISLLLVIFLFSGIQPVTGQSTNKKSDPLISAAVKKRIDSTLTHFIDAGKTAGLSALIFEKGKEIYFNAFGFADKEANVPMNRNTIVRIFSMTKPITGVALMTLYEQGAFHLDEPLAKYAPEFANMQVYKGVDANGKMILEPAKRPITIRDITRHTAGFPGTDIPALATLVKNADAFNPNNSLAQMAAKLASVPLQFHPGDEWLYGPSVDVQAYLVERISGKPFDQYIQKNILDPLGMKHTHYVVPEKDRKQFAAVYFRNNEGVLSRVPDEQASTFNLKNWTLKPGGWGLTSTLDDYTKFAQMLVNKGALGKVRILKPETIALMATNQLPDTLTKRSWLPGKGNVGFGIDFAVRVGPPATREETNGATGEFYWDGAASTLFWVDPVNEITVVLFTQLFPYDPVKLHKTFRDAVYGEYQPLTNKK
ncbi:serine hydrolase domain-containing protein [Pseudoflavitalea rhizosphaerae]|uniref:serine hydrolase domain-containing protein n=1 Tax=Pseudoflavitalea rhizosphaerae TaxID=1884793 RepID=UPI000F8F121C|nr:serine hydrolase domain-containing protein [Pseudoflavitalea rhizosphaerae]